MARATHISHRIIDAILSEQFEPNARLGEQEVATLFGCSRTIVREAMIELATRGIVHVNPRRGWFLREVTSEQARELYEAREIIETGLLQRVAQRGTALAPEVQTRLREHLAQQRAVLGENDAGRRSYWLGDFHVCLAECLGNHTLAGQLRDLTVLTTLYTTQHQTPSDAQRSYDEHVGVVEALCRGDLGAAACCMQEHLGTWEQKVNRALPLAPRASLRRALAAASLPLETDTPT